MPILRFFVNDRFIRFSRKQLGNTAIKLSPQATQKYYSTKRPIGIW